MLGRGCSGEGLVAGRIEERNQRLVLVQALKLGLGGLTHLGDDVGLFPQSGSGLDDLDPGLLVGGVLEPGGLARPGLDHALVAEFL